MAYVGTPIDTTNQFQSLQGKRFDGDGSTTDFTLDIAPSSVFDIEVFVENVRQDPNSAYTLSGTTLSFTGAPPSGTNNIYVVHQAKAVGTINPTNDSVTASSIADDAVESEHLNDNIISGQTALAATPADTDEFLISDAGTIKRIDYSLIKSTNAPYFYGVKASNQTLSRATSTVITGFTTNELDSDTAFDGQTFTVPSGKGGIYYFHANIFGSFGSVGNDGEEAQLNFRKNNSQITRPEAKHLIANSYNIMRISLSFSIIQDLSAGDTMEVMFSLKDGDASSSTDHIVTNQSHFMGFKLA